jgi:hypothetical protein
VSNTLPVLADVTIEPEHPSEATRVICTAGATSDDDGDTVSVAWSWTVDGVLTSITGASIDGRSFDRGQVVACTGTPSDGSTTGTGVTASATIENAAPEAPTVAIDPPKPIEGIDDVLCDVVTPSVDLDGDKVDYRMSWKVDGADWTGTTLTSIYANDTIPSGEGVAGEVWECTATPNDGFDDGATATASATIVPNQVIYLIKYADLFGQGSTCSSTAYDSVYNGCGSNWGFTWKDTASVKPSKVTVEMYHGIWCSSSTSKSPTLNGVAAGSFSLTGGNCVCDPSKAVNKWVLTSLSGYAVGSTNTFTIPYGGSCEGLSVNSTWGTGVYAKVTVDY